MNGASSHGRISLWTSIVGFLLPLSLFEFLPENAIWLRAILGLLLVLELIAMGFGYAGRSTVNGKVGLGLSLVVLLLVLTAFVIHHHAR